MVRDAARGAALLPAGVEIAVAGLADIDSLRSAATGCSGVLHLAGSVGSSEEETRRTNVDGTRAVLAAAGSGLGDGAGTFARRSEVYGRIPPVRVRDAGARALGFVPRGIDDGLAATAAWLGAGHS